MKLILDVEGVRLLALSLAQSDACPQDIISKPKYWKMCMKIRPITDRECFRCWRKELEKRVSND